MEEQKTWRESAKKYLKIMAKILGGILSVVLVYFAYIYVQIERGELTKWNGEWYTKAELKEKFPPQYGVTPSQNNPEEVYATFRQALLDNNLELALEQITVQQREGYRKIFQNYKNLETLGQIYPQKISKDNEDGNYSNFSYTFIKNGQKINSSIQFTKNYMGYWKIYII